MKVFVAGASGAIGRPVGARLTRAGRGVAGMVRSDTDLVYVEGYPLLRDRPPGAAGRPPGGLTRAGVAEWRSLRKGVRIAVEVV
jgi:nucleoside-diphosphate-sugar epimerase